MFTGIVTDIGEVVSVGGRQGSLERVLIHSGYDAATIAVGASIACGGPCLTVIARGGRPHGCWFEVEAAAETLALTTVGEWAAGSRVNLERSLRIGDELGGHLVSGHVDGIAELLTREDLPDMARLFLRVPAPLSRFIAPKGSAALDGVSLTVNEVAGDTFSVLLIPHTLQVTTFGSLRAGAHLNLEVDQMARYAARLLQTAGA